MEQTAFTETLLTQTRTKRKILSLGQQFHEYCIGPQPTNPREQHRWQQELYRFALSVIPIKIVTFDQEIEVTDPILRQQFYDQFYGNKDPCQILSQYLAQEDPQLVADIMPTLPADLWMYIFAQQETPLETWIARGVSKKFKQHYRLYLERTYGKQLRLYYQQVVEMVRQYMPLDGTRVNVGDRGIFYFEFVPQDNAWKWIPKLQIRNTEESKIWHRLIQKAINQKGGQLEKLNNDELYLDDEAFITILFMISITEPTVFFEFQPLLGQIQNNSKAQSLFAVVKPYDYSRPLVRVKTFSLFLLIRESKFPTPSTTE